MPVTAYFPRIWSHQKAKDQTLFRYDPTTQRPLRVCFYKPPQVSIITCTPQIYLFDANETNFYSVDYGGNDVSFSIHNPEISCPSNTFQMKITNVGISSELFNSINSIVEIIFTSTFDFTQTTVDISDILSGYTVTKTLNTLTIELNGTVSLTYDSIITLTNVPSTFDSIELYNPAY